MKADNLNKKGELRAKLKSGELKIVPIYLKKETLSRIKKKRRLS